MEVDGIARCHHSPGFLEKGQVCQADIVLAVEKFILLAQPQAKEETSQDKEAQREPACGKIENKKEKTYRKVVHKKNQRGLDETGKEARVWDLINKEDSHKSQEKGQKEDEDQVPAQACFF